MCTPHYPNPITPLVSLSPFYIPPGRKSYVNSDSVSSLLSWWPGFVRVEAQVLYRPSRHLVVVHGTTHQWRSEHGHDSA